MKIIQTKLNSCSSGVHNPMIGKAAYPIGLHVGNSQGQIIEATTHHNQHSHFQNAKLQKELAEIRTISLDRVNSGDGIKASTSDKYTHNSGSKVRLHCE